MRIFAFIVTAVLLTGCRNQKFKKFEDFLIGDWRIENPTLQSFIRFEENGKLTYFMNRYSYQLDSLSQMGKWSLDKIQKGNITDTFTVTIDNQSRKILFHFIAVDENKIKVIDDGGQVFFTRIRKTD